MQSFLNLIANNRLILIALGFTVLLIVLAIGVEVVPRIMTAQAKRAKAQQAAREAKKAAEAAARAAAEAEAKEAAEAEAARTPFVTETGKKKKSRSKKDRGSEKEKVLPFTLPLAGTETEAAKAANGGSGNAEAATVQPASADTVAATAPAATDPAAAAPAPAQAAASPTDKPDAAKSAATAGDAIQSMLENVFGDETSNGRFEALMRNCTIVEGKQLLQQANNVAQQVNARMGKHDPSPKEPVK
ncbi:MAG: hypothetical protein U0528_05780 [Anaerolineae bacterium]